jgi:mannose-6-phosphate isomerase-like protein (cupin superfamily)
LEDRVLTSKIQVEELPVTEEFTQRKRLIQPRGELALIEDGKLFRHLGYFSLKRGQDFYRGGHYHLNKIEHFYVISGRILIRLHDMETGEKSVVEVRTGDCVILHPNCAHRFEAIEDAQVIEYYDSVYSKDDDIPHQHL